MSRRIVGAVSATDPCARRYRPLLLGSLAAGIAALALPRLVAGGGPTLATAALAQTAIVLLLAPALALDSISRRRRQGTLRHLLLGPARSWQIALAASLRPWLASLGLVAASGAPLWLLAAGPGLGAAGRLVPAQLELACIAMAFASLGLACSAWFAEVGSAAAVAYSLVLVLLAAPLLIAPAIDGVSGADDLVAAALLASPAVAVAAASGLDLMRAERVYRATPIGQRRFSYPRPWSVLLLFAAMNVTFSCALTWRLAIERRRGTDS